MKGAEMSIHEDGVEQLKTVPNGWGNYYGMDSFNITVLTYTFKFNETLSLS